MAFADTREREIEVRWLSDNIGAVEARFGGVWHTVPAVHDVFRDRSAWAWKLAAERIRAGNPESREAGQKVIARAFEVIEDRNHQRLIMAGHLPDQWSHQEIAKADRRLFDGFKISEPKERVTEHPGELGRKLPDLAVLDRNESEHAIGNDLEPPATEPQGAPRRAARTISEGSADSLQTSAQTSEPRLKPSAGWTIEED